VFHHGIVTAVISEVVMIEQAPTNSWDHVTAANNWYINTDGVLTVYDNQGRHGHFPQVVHIPQDVLARLPKALSPQLPKASASHDQWAHVTAANRWYITGDTKVLTQYDPDGRNHRHYGHVSALPPEVQARIPHGNGVDGFKPERLKDKLRRIFGSK
jgi:hypothetical protein